MNELPQPDLMDHGGRMRRIVVSLLIGLAAIAITYFVANTIIEPENQARTTYVNRNMGPDGFVFWASGIAGFVSFTVAIAVQNWLARRKSERERVPVAKAR
jgi:hypothetical protein